MSIVRLPEFKDGVRKYNGLTFEVDPNEYIIDINSLQDFRNKILNDMDNLSIEECDNIKEDIIRASETNTVFKSFTENRKAFESRIKSIFRDYDESTKLKYEDEIEQAKTLIKKGNAKSTKYIIENKEAIFVILNESREIQINKLKERRKEVNNKYYQKRKQLLNIPDKIAMSEEERKEKRKLANQKYREKQKQLSDVHQVKVAVVVDEKDKKKEYNRTYYNKQKLLKDKIKDLEVVSVVDI
jgi:hypothetical protein